MTSWFLVDRMRWVRDAEPEGGEIEWGRKLGQQVDC